MKPKECDTCLMDGYCDIQMRHTCGHWKLLNNPKNKRVSDTTTTKDKNTDDGGLR